MMRFWERRLTAKARAAATARSADQRITNAAVHGARSAGETVGKRQVDLRQHHGVGDTCMLQGSSQRRGFQGEFRRENPVDNCRWAVQ